MSFGWAAGDIIASINIMQTVISAIKDGPSEYREIHRELLSLNIALNSVQENADDPESLLNRKGQPRKQELLEILANCRKVVDEVQSLINKHSPLQTRGRSIRRVWDAYRVGSADLDTLRGRLTLYTSTIDMFLHSLEGPALARIEGMVRMLVENMGITPNVAGSSRMSIASVASTATILSILDPDQEGEAWKFLRAELMADGILPSHLATHKMEIISYLKTLIAGVKAISPGDTTASTDQGTPWSADALLSPTSTVTTINKDILLSPTKSNKNNEHERHFLDANEAQHMQFLASPTLPRDIGETPEATTLSTSIDPSQEDDYKIQRVASSVFDAAIAEIEAFVEAPPSSPVSNKAIEPVGSKVNLDSVPTSGPVSSVATHVNGWKTDDVGFFNYRPAVVRFGVTDNGRKSAFLFCVEVSPNRILDNVTDWCNRYRFTLEAGNQSHFFNPVGHYPEIGQLHGRMPWSVYHTHGLTWRLWPSTMAVQGCSAFRLAALFDMGMHKLNEPVMANIRLQRGIPGVQASVQSIIGFAITNLNFQQSSPTILKAQDLVNAASGTYTSITSPDTNRSSKYQPITLHEDI